MDASIYAPFYFGLFPPDDPRVVSTMQAIQDRLQVKTAVGGYARYEGDGYFRASEDLAQVPGQSLAYLRPLAGPVAHRQGPEQNRTGRGPALPGMGEPAGQAFRGPGRTG